MRAEASAQTARCHLCGGVLREVEGYNELSRVTSDCKPWRPGGRLMACRACNVGQKLVNDEWRREINEVYGGYTLYHQGAGVEQAVFPAQNGIGIPRSTCLVRELIAKLNLPPQGRLLEIGAGLGTFIRAFAEERPAWRVTATEISDDRRVALESIPQVEQFSSGDPGDLSGRFDLIVLIHVLEHVIAPGQLLEKLASKLEVDGHLLIQVPDCERNPFDVLIVDHASHFTRATLTHLATDTHLHPVEVAGWLPKEISLVATRGGVHARSRESSDAAAAEQAVQWLHSLNDAAHRTRTTALTSFGVFGTAIAGTWLFEQLAGDIGFFVDEDPARRGRTFLGKPVHAPTDVPRDATVLVGLAGEFAAGIADRLGRQRPDVSWIAPPAFCPS